MIVLLATALIGGLFSFAVLWPYGALTALLGAQIGATLLTIMAGLLLASQRVKTDRKLSAASRLIASLSERSQPQVLFRRLQ
jgi:hypothetical protein